MDKIGTIYRIVTGVSWGYNIQILYWWFPFWWLPVGFESYHMKKEAEQDIKLLKTPKVKKDIKIIGYY